MVHQYSRNAPRAKCSKLEAVNAHLTVGRDTAVAAAAGTARRCARGVNERAIAAGATTKDDAEPTRRAMTTTNMFAENFIDDVRTVEGGSVCGEGTCQRAPAPRTLWFMMFYSVVGLHSVFAGLYIFNNWGYDDCKPAHTSGMMDDVSTHTWWIADRAEEGQQRRKLEDPRRASRMVGL